MYLIPSDNYETHLNGKLLKDKTKIYNGDRIVLGGTHTFRLINPTCTNWQSQSPSFTSNAETEVTEEILREHEKRIRREMLSENRSEIRRIEMEHKSKISECHTKMNQLESELRKLKNQKSSENSDVDIERIRQILQPYETTLLDDIKSAFRDIDADILNKVKEKVRNANEWCRTKGNNLEFRYHSSNDDFGLLTIQIRVVNRQKCEMTIWPVQRFDLWYEKALEGTDIMELLDANWQPLEQEQQQQAPLELPQEQSTPRKALNALTEIGRSLVRSPMQKIRSTLVGVSGGGGGNEQYQLPTPQPRARRALLAENKENILNAMKENTFESEALLCLIDMQDAVIRLKKLSKKVAPPATADASLIIMGEDDDDENGEVSEKLRKELTKNADEIEKLVHSMSVSLTTEKEKKN